MSKIVKSVGSIVRHTLTVVGGALLTNGLAKKGLSVEPNALVELSSQVGELGQYTVETILGGIFAAGGFILSLVEKNSRGETK